MGDDHIQDTRFCYGAQCTWCGPIAEVSNTHDHPYWKERKTLSEQHSIPCCPNCGGMLMEYETAEEWWDQVRKYDAEGHPGYLAMWQWQRQHKPLCFPSMEVFVQTYKNREHDSRFRTRHG